MRERAAERNRIQKTLEGAGIKLGDVASDVFGVSGRRMLEALVGGTTDPAVLAALARGPLRDKLPQLERALAGQVGPHQRFLLARQLTHLDDLETVIEQLSAEITERLRPFQDQLARLDAIAGVGQRTAEVILAEIGPEVARFPSAAHLASWAGLCPGNHQSAGKRKSGQTGKGDVWLRAALVEAAHAASRRKDSYFAGQYRRLAARRGPKKAILAVAHSLLRVIYHLLAHDCPYTDLGARYLDERDREQIERRLVRRLQAFGYTVTLEPAA